MPRTNLNSSDVFVAECYVAASGMDAATGAAERVRAACAAGRRAGEEVTYLGGLVVADDELAFHVFAAPDAGAVHAICQRATLRVERVVAAVAVRFPKPAPMRALGIGIEDERSVAHAPGEIGS